MTTPVSHGRTRRAITVGPFTVTEAVYAPRQRVQRHEHGWPSWTLVLDGSFEECFSHGAIVARPGAVLTKPATADHSNEYGPRGARCLLIGSRDREQNSFGDPALHAAGVVPLLARRIHAELGAAECRIARFALEGLLIELALATVRARPPRPTGRTAWLNDVRDQLEAEFRTPPALADLAHARGVHPAYLCQAFRAAFGTSMGEFARRVRFEWARAALRTGHASLSGIALAAGFSDQAHFCRDFKKRAGISPRQSRWGSRLAHSGPRPFRAVTT
ncbi:MAG TPA: AraC family transcriptional regulator [Gemmatimonadales bacterium]|nr:AraC family transcriptional regulator [Gemmatimonadales bacterium]